MKQSLAPLQNLHSPLYPGGGNLLKEGSTPTRKVGRQQEKLTSARALRVKKVV